MPFTGSHAAAVLPFRRTRLPWPALVIGSFGPDFEYFLRVSGHSRAWHYYPAVFTRCLPFTVVVYLLFMAFMRGPLIDLLPIAIQQRIPRNRSGMPKRLSEAGLVFLALIVGIATHVLWDSFTHPRSWFWRHIAFLRASLKFGALPRVYAYQIAQAASSVLGLAILIVTFVHWYRRTPTREVVQDPRPASFRVAVAAIILLLPAAGACWRGYHAEEKLQSPGELASAQLVFVITAVSIFLWELVIYGAVATVSEIRKRAHR